MSEASNNPTPNGARNRLVDETSPYLLQHADNPVHWYAWGMEAVERARREDKPILLSIGYSSCHWCHVMAHESFEDSETAAVMNEHFVNIKVDREERPDLDRIYQTSHQILTQRPGGWPLTVFLAPDDLSPFFAGTYFPAEPRHGLPAFKDLLDQISHFYGRNRDDLAKQSTALQDVLEKIKPQMLPADVGMALQPFHDARRILESEFDPQYGGFGPPPRFPHAANLELLLSHADRAEHLGGSDRPAQRMAIYTLKRMLEGGIFDQLGGGFYRYSTDAQWIIPHFEKMLYDNGPLLSLLAVSAQITRDAELAKGARETAAWVMREMQSPEGGYYAALDADSEGSEGLFYTWRRDEVQETLGSEDYALFAARYGLVRRPNFEGRWHLHVFESLDSLERSHTIPRHELIADLDEARQKLFQLREKRVRPGLDDKILVSWNAMMILGMARAARMLEEPSYYASARRAFDFIHATCWNGDELRASWRVGKARFAGYLDDYAFLADAGMELLRYRYDGEVLNFVIELLDALLDKFEDSDNGGFFFTAHDQDTPVHRPKTFSDDAMPSGNGIAVRLLNRVGNLLGDIRYLTAAEKALRAGYQSMSRVPHSHSTLALALLEFLEPCEIVIIRGTEEAAKSMQSRLEDVPHPGRLVLAIPDDMPDLHPALQDKKPVGDCVAYVCTGTECSPPLRDYEDLERFLSGDKHFADSF